MHRPLRHGTSLHRCLYFRRGTHKSGPRAAYHHRTQPSPVWSDGCADDNRAAGSASSSGGISTKSPTPPTVKSGPPGVNQAAPAAINGALEQRRPPPISVASTSPGAARATGSALQPQQVSPHLGEPVPRHTLQEPPARTARIAARERRPELEHLAGILDERERLERRYPLLPVAVVAVAAVDVPDGTFEHCGRETALRIKVDRGGRKLPGALGTGRRGVPWRVCSPQESVPVAFSTSTAS